jgi:hypothetical protein
MIEENAEQGIKNKKIYILMTKQTDPVSRVFGLLSGSRYFHASIGFEERGTFFSFNTKRGFCIEQPAIKRQFVPCALYSIDVTEEVYTDIEERIKVFRENPNPYRFAWLGMFLAIFRMPLKIPFLFMNSYFCTMFVSELIVKSGAATLKFKPYRYLPRHFSHEPELKLCFEGVWGQPPVFSEDGGDLYTIPIRYVKRYAGIAQKKARVTVKIAKRGTYRHVRVAHSKMILAKNYMYRAPGKLGILCRDNLYTVTKRSRDAIEKWWMSLM